MMVGKHTQKHSCIHHVNAYNNYYDFLSAEVTIMLNAPDVVPEAQQSVITACISIVGNTVIETEVRVAFSTINVNQQGK